MNKINPLLKDGMIVLKDKDDREGYCYYKFSRDRYENNRRAICFEHMIPAFEKLGFEILPHWTKHGRARGWYAVRGVQYIGPLNRSNIDKVQIDPVVQSILNDSISNKSFKNLLLQEGE